jgi:phosphomannomutase
VNEISISGFKAYDLRGRIPGELNEDVAYRIGRAYAEFVKPRRVIVGRDIRLSSEMLCKALEQGLLDSGVDVHDIGLCGTEVVYFATFAREMDGGIMVTASHNPPDYNGMKFVREGSRPISGDTGLQEIRRIAESGRFTKPAPSGKRPATITVPAGMKAPAAGITNSIVPEGGRGVSAARVSCAPARPATKATSADARRGWGARVDCTTWSSRADRSRVHL